ncbi:(E)-4-hydroxy-3-methylbut-2-enyl-diphosphate synthase [Pontibacter sp. G13]|uniref:(E)-4-hydroxy-3-methylbut-2-enyl-diphosphate synthase n=1 Tax=Pontibacter sp. G13 TaxID=3074898 RepID=UPI00288AE659|nr:(E)-4-hydroxy-3-methylbut-2-enyl-diphosphate synthase [Pontibacter sp. G13]WNJ17990.1 (E)-4-hydroxy-3-methylbut-2-enyl-diphosphate synthase [Pontibacter sp. G13]
MELQVPYTPKHLSYQRILSREVQIGNVPVGGTNPIRIQSMTTTDTMDTMATVEQSIRMVEAGCEYVRITAPSKNEANNLAEIKKELRARGYDVPLVADIHFTPNAAEVAARIVEKVRVNPGNYADKKKFKEIIYTDESYQEEIDRIYKRFSPLVKICKEEGTAMRIGTNHGSLSDRIMSRYGDTPKGMVESAMEFVRICEDHGFHNLVISMKASNPQVMVQAYRLLMEEMIQRGEIYPMHLGVTEAGEGEDGRIKSALGISTLLLDGIGDTVRVSLTEEPEHEMPVAQFLIDHVVKQANQMRSTLAEEPSSDRIELPFDPYQFHRRDTAEILNIGHGQVPRVVADITKLDAKPASLREIGYTYVEALDKYNFSDIAADFAYLGAQVPPYELPGGLKPVYDHATWLMLSDRTANFPAFDTVEDYLNADEVSEVANFVRVTSAEMASVTTQPDRWEKVVFVLMSSHPVPTYDWRSMLYALAGAGIQQPTLISMSLAGFDYYDDSALPEFVRIEEEAKIQLALSSNGSTLLVDGLIDGIWLEEADDCRLRTAFGMLQLARLRITKTEYISCPSCGRTLFDLQETTAMIRKQTEHLKGVKIGIMGCIVNGPGEMADADYGYVGVGPDKIALYRGQEVVVKAVPTAEAVGRLIDLIREDDMWVEPEVASTL